MSYYEIFQLERYGNILPTSNHEEELENGVSEDFELWTERQVEIDLMDVAVVDDFETYSICDSL